MSRSPIRCRGERGKLVAGKLNCAVAAAAGGKTVLNRLSDSSRYTLTPSGSANGQTPPTAWPVMASASSAVSIFALKPNCVLKRALSTFTSPAITIIMQPSPMWKERDLAIRAPQRPAPCAASPTVALEVKLHYPPAASKRARYSFTFAIDDILCLSPRRRTLPWAFRPAGRGCA